MQFPLHLVLLCLGAVSAAPGPLPLSGRVSSAPAVTLSFPSGSSVTYTGSTTSSIDKFTSIPFAQQPVGDLRFVPPQPILTPTGSTTVDATVASPACPQGGSSDSESCLNLDIYRPTGTTASSLLPVIVWVYGGSFTGGQSSTYDGSNFISISVTGSKPILYVAINYRLGLLGFPQGNGPTDNNALNLGLLDVAMSLTWVQSYITEFGGDPTKVTLAGESAGAILASMMYFHPQATTLFRGAIMQSGAQSSYPQLKTGSTIRQADYDLVIANLSCNNYYMSQASSQLTWNCVKNKTLTELLAAQSAVEAQDSIYPFGPVIDGPSGGWITEAPSVLLANGEFAKIPFISGNNLDEGTLFVPTTFSTTADVLTYFESTFPDVPAINKTAYTDLINLYPDDPSAGSPFGTGTETFGLGTEYKRTAAIFGDASFQAPRRNFLRQAVAQSVPCWSYLFAEPAAVTTAAQGVTHSTELTYVFGAVALDTTKSTETRMLSGQMIEYWINFAVYNTPDSTDSPSTTLGLISWPEYGSSQNMIQFIGGNLTIIPDTYRSTQMDFVVGNAISFAHKKRNSDKRSRRHLPKGPARPKRSLFDRINRVGRGLVDRYSNDQLSL